MVIAQHPPLLENLPTEAMVSAAGKVAFNGRCDVPAARRAGAGAAADQRLTRSEPIVGTCSLRSAVMRWYACGVSLFGSQQSSICSTFGHHRRATHSIGLAAFTGISPSPGAVSRSPQEFSSLDAPSAMVPVRAARGRRARKDATCAKILR